MIPDSPFWCARYIQAVNVYQWFFLQPTQRANLYYFRKTTRFHFTARQREIIVWSFARREIYLHIDIKIFFSIFLSIEVALNILFHDFDIFCMSLFGCFRFCAPTRFREVICPTTLPVRQLLTCPANSIKSKGFSL